MASVVEFLEARLAEDADRLGIYGEFVDECQECAIGQQPDSPYSAARLLREVEAKRAIVGLCTASGVTGSTSSVRLATRTLVVLASVYADHPDFDREAWGLTIAR